MLVFCIDFTVNARRWRRIETVCCLAIVFEFASPASASIHMIAHRKWNEIN